MTTARFRCSACGEPLVRPVLSCPYCGAFRPAVALDGTPPLSPPLDSDVPATVEREPQEALRPATDDVIPTGDAPAGHPDASDRPRDDVAPADTQRPAEPPAAPDRSAPPLPPSVAAEPPVGPGDDAPEAAHEDAGSPRRPAERSFPDAVPAAGRPAEPDAARRSARVEPSVSGGRQRPLGPDARRAGRLDRGAAMPVPDGDAPAGSDDGEGAAPEPPREPVVPRPPARRRRAGADLSRRRAGEDAAAGSAWLASGAAPEDTTEEDDPSIDDVLREAEHEEPRRRRGRDRSLGAVPDHHAEAGEKKRRRGNGGWIALLLFLLVLAGGIGYAAYWVDKAGIADLLRSPNREVSSLGEADQVEVPGDWISVVTPGAGGATEVLVSADGPFRMRVDGTVYTLDGSTAVRVPVKTTTLLELKALGSPVTASITRLGEAPANP